MSERLPASADELADWLAALFPAFRAALSASPFLPAGGELTPHGVCMVFTHFYRSQVPDYGAPEVAALFIGIEAITAADPKGHFPLSNAVSTCFLENIAGEPAGALSRPLMGPLTRAFFDPWHGPSAMG